MVDTRTTKRWTIDRN